MADNFTIQYLQYDEIDQHKWDHCVRNAGTDLIYGYSWYLNHMSKNWDALVLGDYEAIMPLTWNRKYGITYIYPPFLTAQSGIIGRQVTKKMVLHFLNAIPAKFRYAEINLNCANDYELPGFKPTRNDNYFLSLNKPYTTLSKKFNQNLQRNIKKAAAAGARYQTGIPLSQVLKLAASQLRQYTRMQPGDLPRFKKLAEYLLQQQKAITAGVYINDELLASGIFFYGETRIYYILAGNHPNGKKYGASHYLFDQFIKDHAGSDNILDFEGSNFSSIARFYQSFGASVEHYSSVKINRLPAVIRWMKER